MSDNVRELYEEAAWVAPLSRRAGAALARAMVERLLKAMDPDAPKRANLDKYVERALDKVSTPLAELLDVVRNPSATARSTWTTSRTKSW
jgi:hypothetical protein